MRDFKSTDETQEAKEIVDCYREMMGMAPLYRKRRNLTSLQQMLNLYHHTMEDGNRQISGNRP